MDARKVAIVTGGNAGIGYETAFGLASRGWEVVIASRSFQRGNEAVMALNTLLRQLGLGAGTETAGRVVYMELDLASLASVRAFADGFKKRYPACAALLLNAGVMAGPHGLSEDGFERQFQINYLGHALLAALLLSPLRAAGNARVVSLSSRAHERVGYRAGDFMRAAYCASKDYRPFRAYARSKFFQVAFTAAAQEENGGAGLRYYAVHPGVINTSLVRRVAPFGLALGMLGPLASAVGLVGRPSDGARTPLYLIMADPAPTGGGYWAGKRPRQGNSRLADRRVIEEIWVGTNQVLGL